MCSGLFSALKAVETKAAPIGLPRCGKIYQRLDKDNAETYAIGTSTVHLTSPVSSRHIDLGLVDKSNDLDIVRCLDEPGSLQGALGEEAGSMAGLRAPCDRASLHITQLFARGVRSPNTEIWHAE